MKKKLIIVGIISILLLGLIFAFRIFNPKEPEITFETVKVKTGSVSNTITATGTIEATKTVEVGTQVSGVIHKIYVDFNTQVKAGQLLAEIDTKPLITALTLAEASLDNAKAEMQYQEATFTRIKSLSAKKLIADSEYDLALYNYEKALSSLKSAQLNYDKAKINLEYAYITSPIDGIILSRAVDEGQTVAASFNTPTLFTIANNLQHMQVEASIDEADIGMVKNNQRVEFTVDAFTEKKFEGKVIQIRLEPLVVSNVVTYTVIVEAPNPDKKLMPGMTANITIFTEEAVDVLTLSGKALRFRPDTSIIHSFSEEDEIKNLPFKHDAFAENGNQRMVWIKNNASLRPVKITTGIDNDIDVEILSGLKEGDEVVIAMSTGDDRNKTTESKAARSPFMPSPPSGKRNNK